MKPGHAKTVLFGLAVLCLAGSGSAAEISAGGRVGLNVSAIFGDTVQGLTPRVGFNLGLYSTQWLNEKLGFQEELMINTKGERWKSGEIDYTAYNHYATSLTYLDIPLLVKWRFMANDALRPSLYAGPDLAFPLIADAAYNGNTVDMMQVTNGLDFGFTAGLSFDIRQGTMFIPLDIRYTLGLTDYAKTGELNLHQRNGVFSISAGLGFLLDFMKKKEF
jgi:hypothetical protein